MNQIGFLESKVIVVTGSTRGIGRGIAEACALAGARVVVSSRNKESVAEVVVQMQSAGLKVAGLAADVSSMPELERLMDFALETYGDLNVLINNAGMSGGYRTLQSMEPEESKEVIDVNLMGTFFGCQIAIPYFREHSGIILNLAGRGGQGNAAPYQSVYAATKAGVVSLTRSLSAENKGYPISINCLMPGMVATDMFRQMTTCPETEGRMGMLPVLLKCFASPMPDVQRLAVRLCAQTPGRHSGRCYSAERWTRYLRAVALVPDFIRTARRISAKQKTRS